MSKQELDFQTNESEPDAQKKFPDRKSQVSASLSTRVNGFAEQLELDEDDIEKMIRDHFGRSIELFYYRKARSWLFDRIRSQLIDDKESDADPLEHKGNAQSSTDAADFVSQPLHH